MRDDLPDLTFFAVPTGEPQGLRDYLYYRTDPPVFSAEGWDHGLRHPPLVVAQARWGEGSTWSGVFTGIDTAYPLCDARLLPSGRHVLVLAFGSGYVVDIADTSRTSRVPGIPLIGVREVPGLPMVIVWGFQDMVAYGPEGEAWRIEHLVPDSMEVRSVSGDSISGGPDDTQDPAFDFEVEPRTGHVRASWGGAVRIVPR